MISIKKRGVGMGKWRRYWAKKGHIPKQIVEQYRYKTIDVSDFYDDREYPLVEGEEDTTCGLWLKLFSERVQFALPSDGLHYSYSTPVEATKCNYGGVRHWFLCPNKYCRRRCKKLHMNQEGYFFCRKCLKLGYYCQKQTKVDSLINKKWALVEKLGAKDYFIADREKPKGMHWSTFNRKRETIEYLHGEANIAMVEWMGLDI